MLNARMRRKIVSQSEVANLLARIKEEYESAIRGLSGPASGANNHLFITRRMENMGKLNETLQGIVGKEQAMILTINTMSHSEQDVF